MSIVPVRASSRVAVLCLLITLAGGSLLLTAGRASAARWTQTPALTNETVTPGSSPSQHLNTEGNLRIYFAANDAAGKMRQLVWNNGLGWADQTLTTSGKVLAGTSPTSFPWANAGVRSYYVDSVSKLVREVNYTTGTGWSDQATTASTGAHSQIMAGTSPSAARNSEGNSRIYFVAADGRLRELAWNAGLGWAPEGTLPVTVAVAPNTSPSHIATPTGGGTRVYYVGAADKKVHEYSYDAAVGPQDRVLSTTQVVAGTSPSAHLNTENNIRVYFVSTSDQKVHQLAQNSGVWAAETGALSSTQVAAGTSPSSIASPNGGVRTYIVGATDKAIHEISYDAANGWQDSGALSWPVAANSSPSAILNLSGQPRVSFVAAQDNRLHELIYSDDPGWQASTALSTNSVATGTTPSLHVNSEGNLRTYFSSAVDNKLRQVVWNLGLGWADQTVPTNGLVATGASPSSFAWDTGGVRSYYVDSVSKLIRELNLTAGSPWADVATTPSTGAHSQVRAGTSPSAARNSEGNTRIYFVAADGRLRELAWNAGLGWAPEATLPVSVAVAPNTSPSHIATANGGSRVYYVGASDMKIHEYAYDSAVGPGGQDHVLSTTQVVAGTNPSANVTTDGNIRVYFVSAADQKVHQLAQNSGTWAAETGALSGTPIAAGESPVSIASRFGGTRIYVVGTDTFIHELSYDTPNGWQDSGPLTPAVATGTNPTVARCRYLNICVQFVGAGDKRIYQTQFDGGPGWLQTALSDFDSVSNDASARALLASLLYQPERASFDTALRNRVTDGRLLRNVETGEVFYSYNHVIRLITSATATALGVNLATAVRVDTAALTNSDGSPLTRGPDIRPYRTSWDYGGINRTVDTNAEADSVANVFQHASSHTVAASIMPAGLDPTEQPLVDAALRRTIGADGTLLLSVGEAKVYNYAAGRLRYLEDSIGRSLGADMDGAKRMTTSSLASFPHDSDIGNYRTSWNYGGANRAVTASVEVTALANAMALASDTDLGALLSGLSPADLAVMMAWRGDQSTWSDGSSVDDSDVAPTDPSASIRAHWNWFHIHRDWSDARALYWQRYLEDTAMSQGTAAFVFGLSGDVPGVIWATLMGLGSQTLAVKIARAREDANGRGVVVDMGLRCVNIPLSPDVCWPAVWVKPR